jgi:hypothetical protein
MHTNIINRFIVIEICIYKVFNSYFSCWVLERLVRDSKSNPEARAAAPVLDCVPRGHPHQTGSAGSTFNVQHGFSSTYLYGTDSFLPGRASFIETIDGCLFHQSPIRWGLGWPISPASVLHDSGAIHCVDFILIL